MVYRRCCNPESGIVFGFADVVVGVGGDRENEVRSSARNATAKKARAKTEGAK
jgi:hypothetical protein